MKLISQRPLSGRGFTLVELLTTIAVIGVIAAMAGPSFQQLIERRRLVAAAESILTDLRWARTESIKRNKNIRITFAGTDSWSYTIESIDDPTVGTNTPLKTVKSADNTKEFKNVTISQNFGGNDTEFDSMRGVVADNGTVTLTSPSNYQLNVTLSVLGRSRVCAAGTTHLGGYDKC